MCFATPVRRACQGFNAPTSGFELVHEWFFFCAALSSIPLLSYVNPPTFVTRVRAVSGDAPSRRFRARIVPILVKELQTGTEIFAGGLRQLRRITDGRSHSRSEPECRGGFRLSCPCLLSPSHPCGSRRCPQLEGRGLPALASRSWGGARIGRILPRIIRGTGRGAAYLPERASLGPAHLRRALQAPELSRRRNMQTGIPREQLMRTGDLSGAVSPHASSNCWRASNAR